MKYHLILCVSCLLSTAIHATPAPNEINVPFKLVKGLIIVEAEFNSQTGNFIFDTGAEDLLLDLEYTSGEKVEFSSLNGTITTFRTEVENVTVGAMKKKKVDAYITNLTAIESFLGMEIDGILGCSFFIPNSVIIDFHKGQLRISEKEIVDDNMWQFDRVDFKFSSGITTVQVKINEVPYTFCLDSGATSHFVDDKVVSNHPQLFNPTGETVDIVTASTFTEPVNKVSASSFILGTKEHESAIFCPKDFTDFNRNTDKEISGIISLTKLSKRYLAIDLKNNRIYY